MRFEACQDMPHAYTRAHTHTHTPALIKRVWAKVMLAPELLPTLHSKEPMENKNTVIVRVCGVVLWAKKVGKRLRSLFV